MERPNEYNTLHIFVHKSSTHNVSKTPTLAL